jgi:catechol 2,3-dioxygenase-like lactoylglutathione lyase family enzyme
MIQIEGITHWAIPVNDLDESEVFYRDVLGLEYKGRLPGGRMACVTVGDNRILLCQRTEKLTDETPDQHATHYSFTVNPDSFEDGIRTLRENNVPIVSLVYRQNGFFLGRELYFLDPSGNRLELRDATWQAGMPTPPLEELGLVRQV